MLHMNRAPENMNDPFAEAGADEVSRFQCITSIEDPEEWYNAVLDFVLMYQSRQSLCGGSERAERVRHTSAAAALSNPTVRHCQLLTTYWSIRYETL